MESLLGVLLEQFFKLLIFELLCDLVEERKDAAAQQRVFVLGLEVHLWHDVEERLHNKVLDCDLIFQLSLHLDVRFQVFHHFDV